MRASDFIEAVDAHDPGPPTRLRVPLRSGHIVGAIVQLEVSLGALADEVFFGGVIQGVDRLSHETLLELDPGSDARVRFLRRATATESPQREHRRYPSTLALVWSRGGERAFGRLADISLGGAFIVSRELPATGDEVELQLRTDDPVRLPSLVRWTKNGVNGAEGFGVEFHPKGPARRRLMALVREHAGA
jgi:hypothetical protein